MIDQPTAQDALKKLEPLLGEWALEATSPDGMPWPGEGRASCDALAPGYGAGGLSTPGVVALCMIGGAERFAEDDAVCGDRELPDVGLVSARAGLEHHQGAFELRIARYELQQDDVV